VKPRYLINALLAKFDYAIEKREAVLTRHRQHILKPNFDMAMCMLLMRKPDAVFVQVGAFDGETVDYLQQYVDKHPLKGLMVEPQEEMLTKLKKRFSDQPGVQLVRAAVDETEGEATMYIPEHDYYGKMLASLNREHVLRQCPDVPDLKLREEKVPLRRLESLIDESGLQALDILQVDTEGHDDKVLRSANLQRFCPALINFESKHLPGARQDAIWEELIGLGYHLHIAHFDTLAVHESLAACGNQPLPEKKS